jgi:hypothetical protein
MKIGRTISIALAAALSLLAIPATRQNLSSAYAAIRTWNFAPSVTIVAAEDDPRIPLVGDAVAFWNNIFTELGIPFRLGTVMAVVGAIPSEDLTMLSKRAGWPTLRLPESIRRTDSDIVVALSDGEFISFSARLMIGDKAVIGIKNYRSYPLTLPNVARNVIAHELGHVIGLSHNADPTTLMCGRPASCRPDLFASDKRRYFPLTDAEKDQLQRMYLKNRRQPRSAE